MPNDIFTVDDSNNAAVRTVSVTGIAESNKPDIFTTDENGNAAIRVTGSGGSVDEDRIIIKSDEIPVASASELGKMYCYSGTTNANYTHGYVYECVQGATTYEGIIVFDPHKVVFDTEAGTLNAFFEENNVSDYQTVVSGTMTYAESGDIWSLEGKDAENNTVFTGLQLYTQDLIDAGFVFINPMSDYADGEVIDFEITWTASSTYVWERIDLQPQAKLGRYLSSWNCATGLAGTNPPESPYEYTTGDYFIVGTVAGSGQTNYKPNGSSYVIGQASTTVETNTVAINDTYFYDGTNWTLLKTGSAVTSVNGQTGDVTVQETLVSGTNIKTIDGNSVLGAGNLELSTYLTYPAGWTTNSTTKAFCDGIAADATAVVGKAYLGEVTFSDLPGGMLNGEVVVEIMKGTTVNDKVIVLSLKSGNVAPYAWQYVYWDNGTNVSGWKTWQETLVSGTNIKTVNNTSLLGSGNITIDSGANTDLSNLTSVGKNIGNWSSNVSNCLTEIPQDIKLELSAGALTLKSGSKVYIPAGKNTISQNTNLGSHSWNYLFYGGSKYMIIGNAGYFSTSNDGVNWAVSYKDTQLGSKAWMCIAYDGTKYVALGSSGGMSTSTDGTTWSTAFVQQNLGSNSWSILVWDGTQFIAISITGYTSTSIDGNAWAVATENTTLGNNAWRGVAYDGTKYVLLGADGHISTSIDCLTWTTPVQNADLGANSWRRIVYDGTKFVALSATGYISTSTNGTIWTTAVQNADLGNRTWTGLVYDGEKFVATSNSGYTATSEDGVNWGGGELFTNVTINADVTVNAQSATGQTMVFYDSVTGTARCDVLVSDCKSGAAGIASSMVYNLSSNKIDEYDGSVVASGKTYSFPLGVVTVSSGTVTSIDSVLNGLGYMGSVVFGLPGVKGLIPAGLNSDGTLNSTSFTISAITTWAGSTSYDSYKICIAGNGDLTVGSYVYNSQTNTTNSVTPYCLVGTLSATTGGKITAFGASPVVQVVQNIINDNSVSLTETWSASKLNSTLGDIETLLAAI